MPTLPPFGSVDRIRSAGLIIGPAALISAWVASGAVTEGYSPIRDHISDLAAIDAPTRPLMNLGFTAFAGLGYLALAATAPAAAPVLAKRSRSLAVASVGVGAVSMACVVASLVLKDQSGFWQRAGITTTDAWLIAAGLLAVASLGDDQG